MDDPFSEQAPSQPAPKPTLRGHGGPKQAVLEQAPVSQRRERFTAPRSQPAPAALVLVVSSDRRLRVLLGQVLKNQGYEVVTAPEAYTALDHCERRRPDVIVGDIDDATVGVSWLRTELEQRTERPAPPVVAIAPRGTEVEGAICTLAKPLNLARLLEHVAELLQAS